MAIVHGIDMPYADDKYHDPDWNPSVIGKRVPFYDGYEKVTGQAKYSGDIFLPNMLYARILTAPVAHANIKSIDTTKAEELPGVKGVVTYKDHLGAAAARYPDRLYLAEKVRQFQDPVAAVAAETPEIAEEALKLIEVDYEELPVVLDSEQALEPNAPQISPEHFPGNLLSYQTRKRGDVEAGFMAADHIIEEKFVGGTHSLQAPERLCCVANYKNGLLTAYQTSQYVWECRAQHARVLGIPYSNVEVINTFNGAGFGGSTKDAWHGPIASFLSKKTGRPVKIELDIENQINLAVRAKDTIYYKVGYKDDGTITAVEATGYWNAGAYSTMDTMGSWLGSVLNTYSRIENFSVVGYSVLTNIPNGSEYRGFGCPQQWGLEVLFDEIAEAVDLDPVELRHRYVHRQWDKATGSGGSELLVTSSGFPEVIDRIAQSMDWESKWVPFASKPTSPNPLKNGIGIAAGSKGYGWTQHCAVVKLMPDGSVVAPYGCNNFGCQEHTSAGQVIAEVLGLPFEKVKVSWGDTDMVPFSTSQTWSRHAVCGGTAYRHAAEDLKQQMFAIAAQKLDTTAGNLEIKDGNIIVKGDPSKSTPIQGLTSTELLAFYETNAPGNWWGCYDISQTCGGVEIEVDSETGGIHVLKHAFALDCGRALNRDVVEGQIDGGASQQGIGEPWMADIIYDMQTGIPLNYGILGHKYPLAADLPPTECIVVESVSPMTSFGQKGIGEMSTVGGRAYLSNAVYNAVGIRLRELTISPAKILKALGKG